MMEWWTYRPSDFLMFSGRSWARLLEALNRDAWPAQPLLLVVGMLLVVLAWQRPQAVRRSALLVLAAAWAWVAWNFHWQRFAAINTAAPWFALAWVVQGLALVVPGLRPAPQEPARWMRRAGIALALAAVGYPLATLLGDDGVARAQVAGLAPDPTALLTAGLLLALPVRHRGWLLVVPLLSLAVGWTTAWLLRG
ncbi:MAG TPA: DUF6064 family protein [Ramlibacter sp.]|jgi:hypothetical protein|uniref:DUF6064 family protein n=1 Tax=Ramlibacter sp. TaxID=1917967 RepID=UPI002D4BC58F|nr:DUF6064 family protein [Ramlibacter sp.]HZY18000.1 DUF6064 family protein [Ramlibacter sp.]